MIKKLLYLFILSGTSYVSAQTYTPEEALQKFAKYPQERIYVKFDKPEYLVGETMHFKAYVFSKFTLSMISTNLYFEYLDKNKKIIYKNIVPVYAGIAQGSFNVPKQLTEDIYYFRAYTSWMLNFDEKSQFIKPILIYNPASATKLSHQTAEWSASVHPEGGTLLDNVESKTAVRLHSPAPLPTHWSGYLFENTDPGKKIAEIIFINRELGSLVFIPVAGKSYSIKITDDKGINKTISLPVVMRSGVSIATITSPEGIDYSITSKGAPDGLKGYKILAQNQGELIYSATIKNPVSTVNASIPADSLTKGIVQITVFDTKGNPVAERLCFAPPKIINLTPQVQFTKSSVAPKGLNEWIADADTITTFTYTIEITNDDEPGSGQSFLNTFWLSELSSNSFEGDSYLKTENKEALDLLLISEKWGKFEWATFLNNPVPKLKFIPDNFLTYQGQVTYNRKLVKNEKIAIVMLMPDSSKIFLPANTDSAGRFIVKNLEFRDTAKAFFRINNLNKTNDPIDIAFTKMDDSRPYTGTLPPSAYIVTDRKANDTIPQKIKDYAAVLNNDDNKDDRYKKLEGVVISAKAKNAKEQLNKTLSSPQFRDVNEIVFDFINENSDDASGNILDWLNGKVAGLTVEGETAYMRGQAVKLYLNEWVTDFERLNALPSSEIAMIKVLRTPFMLGSGAPVIAVYTKTASMFKAEPLSLKSARIVGYPTVEKFKPVDYSDEKINPAQNDSRHILYWNTTLTPDLNKQRIRFYNNDTAKRYHLEIIGVKKDGTPVYLNKQVSF